MSILHDNTDRSLVTALKELMCQKCRTYRYTDNTSRILILNSTLSQASPYFKSIQVRQKVNLFAMKTQCQVMTDTLVILYMFVFLLWIAEKKRCQTPFIHKASTETNITFDYPVDDMLDDMLFFCKENDFTCEDIFTTKSSPKSNERFTLKETDSGLTISISHVSPSDAGVYWCGVKTEHYRAALRQIQLEVKGESLTSETLRFDVPA